MCPSVGMLWHNMHIVLYIRHHTSLLPYWPESDAIPTSCRRDPHWLHQSSASTNTSAPTTSTTWLSPSCKPRMLASLADCDRVPTISDPSSNVTLSHPSPSGDHAEAVISPEILTYCGHSILAIAFLVSWAEPGVHANLLCQHLALFLSNPDGLLYPSRPPPAANHTQVWPSPPSLVCTSRRSASWTVPSTTTCNLCHGFLLTTANCSYDCKFENFSFCHTIDLLVYSNLNKIYNFMPVLVIEAKSDLRKIVLVCFSWKIRKIHSLWCEVRI